MVHLLVHIKVGGWVGGGAFHIFFTHDRRNIHNPNGDSETFTTLVDLVCRAAEDTNMCLCEDCFQRRNF